MRDVALEADLLLSNYAMVDQNADPNFVRYASLAIDATAFPVANPTQAPEQTRPAHARTHTRTGKNKAGREASARAISSLRRSPPDSEIEGDLRKWVILNSSSRESSC